MVLDFLKNKGGYMSIQDTVFGLLKDNPELRCSDKLIVAELLIQSPIYKAKPLTLDVYLHSSQDWLTAVYGIPGFETINRARRKYLEKNPLLRPDANSTTRADNIDNRISKKTYEKYNLDPVFVYLEPK